MEHVQFPSYESTPDPNNPAIKPSTSSSSVTSARDGSVKRLGNRDLTGSGGILLNVVVELRHLLRKFVGDRIVALGLLSLKLDDSGHELQDLVLDLSVLSHG